MLTAHCLKPKNVQVDSRMDKTGLDPFPSQHITKYVTKVPPVLNEDTGIAMALDEVSCHGRSLSRKS